MYNDVLDYMQDFFKKNIWEALYNFNSACPKLKS